MNITVASGECAVGNVLSGLIKPPGFVLRPSYCRVIYDHLHYENWTNEATDPSKQPTKRCSTWLIRSVYVASNPVSVVLGFTPHAVCLHVCLNL